VRIDKFLKLSRIIKRRTEAKKACANHCIIINGKIAKSGDAIKPLDKVGIHFRHKILEIEVLEIPNGNVSNNHTPQLYRVIKEKEIPVE
jgi:ribosomal 50S subunit-recycling heat shock protein